MTTTTRPAAYRLTYLDAAPYADGTPHAGITWSAANLGRLRRVLADRYGAETGRRAIADVHAARGPVRLEHPTLGAAYLEAVAE